MSPHLHSSLCSKKVCDRFLLGRSSLLNAVVLDKTLQLPRPPTCLDALCVWHSPPVRSRVRGPSCWSTLGRVDSQSAHPHHCWCHRLALAHPILPYQRGQTPSHHSPHRWCRWHHPLTQSQPRTQHIAIRLRWVLLAAAPATRPPCLHLLHHTPTPHLAKHFWTVVSETLAQTKCSHRIASRMSTCLLRSVAVLFCPFPKAHLASGTFGNELSGQQ